MRKITSFVLAIAMIFSTLLPVGNIDAYAKTETNQTTKQATVNDTTQPVAKKAVTAHDYKNTITEDFDTVAEALEKTKITKETIYITLNTDITEDIVIPASKTVKIELNGHNITNVKSHTILNNGYLTVVGSGIVDNKTHGRGAVYNNINATANLEGGTYTRSAEASSSENNGNGNSWYVLKNFGTMNIRNSGVTVKFSDANPGYFSSLIGNGWQNFASAEAGKNGEPKPSEGKNKAVLKISAGEFIGGQITVKNDDYGQLTISGGTFEQPSADRYVVANNHVATISGGTFKATGANGSAVNSRHFDGDANTGKLTVTGGTFEATDSVFVVENGTETIVTDGHFKTSSDKAYIFKTKGTIKGGVKNGTFEGVTADRVSNSNDVFEDGFIPTTDGKGNVIIELKDELKEATVTDANGNTKKYRHFKDAMNAVTENGSTITLYKDITLDSTAKVSSKAYNITLNLNGHNIDGSKVSENSADGVVCLFAKYGWKPAEGEKAYMEVVNTIPTEGGEIKGYKPVVATNGDGRYELEFRVGEGVKLTTLNEDTNKVILKNTFMYYNENTKNLFKEGGFKCIDTDGKARICESYSGALKSSKDKEITLLNDITSTSKIYSGSESGTLNLDGHTYTYKGKASNGNYVIDVNYPNVTLEIKNGKIIGTEADCNGAMLVGAPNSSQMNNRGLVLDGVELTVPGSEYGIVTNGTETGNKIVLKNSTINIENGYGIYFPSAGSVTIDNSVINAKYVGVQMCAGDLTITGEKTAITTNADPEEKLDGDGVIADGAAISIINRKGYKGIGTVTVENGTFKAKSGVDAMKAYSFSNENKEEEWTNASEKVAISGGAFSTAKEQNIDDVNALCEKGTTAVLDEKTGLVKVVKDDKAPVFNIVDNGTYYGGSLEFTVKDDMGIASVVAGDETLKADENGNYKVSLSEGETSKQFTIKATDKAKNETEITVTLKKETGKIENAQVKLVNQLTANKTEQTQKIEVTLDGITLVEGKDYVVSNDTAVEAGEYELVVLGRGNYEGDKIVKFTVAKNTIANSDVELIGNLIYDGTSQAQPVKVTVGDKVLLEGLDYEVTGNTATKAGTYTLTVKGIGSFEGTATVKYTVAAADMSKATVEMTNKLTANKKEQTQKVSVKLGNTNLVEGTDFTVSGNKAVNPGTYTLTVTGTGNYTGTVDAKYTVAKGTVANSDVELIGNLIYDGTSQVQPVKVTVGDAVLLEGLDYEVTGNTATKAGTYQLTVKGIGSFEGTATAKFTVAAADMSKATVGMANKLTANKKEQVQKVSVKLGNLNLVEGTDFTVSGNKAVKPGKYTLTVTGMGNYTGKVDAQYTVEIGPLDIPVIKGSLKSNKPKISWSKVEYAEKYTVYRSTSKSGKYSKVGTTTGTYYVDKSAYPCKAYYYKVYAYDKNNKASKASKVVKITSGKEIMSVKPSNRSVDGKPMIVWKKVPTASKYVIYRATSKSGKYSKVYTAKGSGTAYINTAAKNGKTYYYKVRAYDKSKRYIGYSSVIKNKTKAIYTKVKIAKSSTKKPRITWSAVNKAYKYEIYRATSKSGKYTKMHTTKNKSYTDTKAKKGKTYYYKVRAVAKKGYKSSFSKAVKIKCVK